MILNIEQLKPTFLLNWETKLLNLKGANRGSNGTLDSRLVPPSMFDPSRENSACAEHSVLQSGELEPCGTVSQTAAVKVKRSGEEGDGVESTWEISPRPNRGGYR